MTGSVLLSDIAEEKCMKLKNYNQALNQMSIPT
jgi:hypothetical protein